MYRSLKAAYLLVLLALGGVAGCGESDRRDRAGDSATDTVSGDSAQDTDTGADGGDVAPDSGADAPDAVDLGEDGAADAANDSDAGQVGEDSGDDLSSEDAAGEDTADAADAAEDSAIDTAGDIADAADAADLADTADATDAAADSDAPCADSDGDGHGTNCVAGADCSDSDANNWVSCDTCLDQDDDGLFAGCDQYVDDIDGPDCDDQDGFVFQEAETYPDLDYDTFGDGDAVAATTCIGDVPPAGLVLAALDCDDTSPLVFPDAVEIPGDGLDNDCGSDGDAPVDETTGVFVVEAPSTCDGSDLGERGCPYTDLQAAIDAAELAGLAVFIAEGSYPPVQTEVSLFGGFATPDWTRTAESPTQIGIPAAGTRGVLVAGTPVVLQDIEVVGTSLTASPVGIQVTTAGIDLTVDGCVVDLAGSSVITGIRMALPTATNLSGTLRVLSSSVHVTTTSSAGGISLPKGVGALYDDVVVTLGVGAAFGTFADALHAQVELTGSATVRSSSITVTGGGGGSGIYASGRVALVEGNDVELVGHTGFVAITTAGGTGTLTQARDNFIDIQTTNSTANAVGFSHQGNGLWEATGNEVRGTAGQNATGFNVPTLGRVRLHNNLVVLSAPQNELGLVSAFNHTEAVGNTFVLLTEGGGNHYIFSAVSGWVLVANNLVRIEDITGNAPGFLLFGGAGARVYVYNNLISMRAGGELAPSVTTIADFNACAWAKCTDASGNLLGDPGFEAGTSYRIASDSLAIDTGIDLLALPVGLSADPPPLDIGGDERPADGPDPEGDASSDSVAEWDIGADEYYP